MTRFLFAVTAAAVAIASPTSAQASAHGWGKASSIGRTLLAGAALGVCVGRASSFAGRRLGAAGRADRSFLTRASPTP